MINWKIEERGKNDANRSSLVASTISPCCGSLIKETEISTSPRDDRTAHIIIFIDIDIDIEIVIDIDIDIDIDIVIDIERDRDRDRDIDRESYWCREILM